MTIKTRLRIGSSFVALTVAGALASTQVLAGDAVISTAQTTPAATSRADGAGPGNLTIAPGGSIRVSAGPAVTLDSSHSLSNQGTLEVTAESNARGVLVTTAAGALNANIADNGAISVPGPASTSSPLWPAYVFNTGIEVSGANAFNGTITRGAGATLTVGGNGGTGIAILTTMNGALVNEGTIRLTRQDSFGIKASGAISGSISNGGAIEALGQEGIGLYAGGGVGGAITNRGQILTGAPATTNAANEAVPAVRGGRALWVANNAAGIYLEGNGVTKEAEPATTLPAGTPADSLLSVRGTAEALYVGQGGEAGNHNITIGALAGNPNGASIVNRGNIAVEAAVRSNPVRAVNITGASAGATIFRTTLTGGLRNEGGDITAFSRDSVAQGIRIGDYASVPSLFNSGLIRARGVDSGETADSTAGGGGGDAYGIVVEAGARLPELVNTGRIAAEARGAAAQSAYAIIDFSGTLTSVVNDGQVIASRRATGSAVALDLSRAAGGANVRNSGSFAGAMLFGAGADRFTSTGGTLLGDVTMGAGNDQVALANTTLTGTLNLGDGAHTVSLVNSVLEGGLSLGAGTADVTIEASTVSIPNGASVSFTNGRIRGGSTLNFNINALNESVGGIRAGGALVVDAGTALNTTISGAVVDQFTVNLIEAGSLTLGADLAGLQPGSTVMYRRQIRLASDNRNILQYQITRRTAAELGLTSQLGAIYDGSVDGLGQDAELSGVMAAFTDQTKFAAALAAMVPDTSDAARRVALSSRALALGAIQRRMSGFTANRNDPLGRFRSGFWLQTLTRFGSADADGAAPGYSLFSMGVAGGLDAEIGDQSILGMSLTQTFGNAEEDARDTGAVKLSATALDFYARANSDFGFVQGTLGYAFNTYRNSRSVAIETVTRQSGGKSPGYQWGAVVDAGTSFAAGTTIFTGYLRAAYHNVYRHAYEEEGGGPAIDLRYDSRSYTSIRGGGGAEIAHRIAFSASNALSLALRADYAHEFRQTPTSVSARFVASNRAFALQGATPAKNAIAGGAGATWERRLSAFSLDYDVDKAGPWLGHSVTLTYRQRF